MRLTGRLHPRPVVFVSVPDLPPDVTPVATVVEPEGLSAVVDAAEADRRGWAHEGPMALITVEAATSVREVGVTAAVAGALAARGIPANVIAGAHHDHVVVPWGDRAEVLELLDALDLPRPEPGRPATGC